MYTQSRSLVRKLGMNKRTFDDEREREKERDEEDEDEDL